MLLIHFCKQYSTLCVWLLFIEFPSEWINTSREKHASVVGEIYNASDRVRNKLWQGEWRCKRWEHARHYDMQLLMTEAALLLLYRFISNSILSFFNDIFSVQFNFLLHSFINCVIIYKTLTLISGSKVYILCLRIISENFE